MFFDAWTKTETPLSWSSQYETHIIGILFQGRTTNPDERTLD